MSSDNSKKIRLVVNNALPKPKFNPGVYLITDMGDDLVERTRAALRGGVAMLQYRTKDKSLDTSIAEGAVLKKLCRKYSVTFIVNDDVDLALKLDADGVHLGQDDGEISSARAALGNDKIIGKSTHNLEEALKAQADGADYIGFGAIYKTSSKNVSQIVGTVGLAHIRNQINIPIVAIGGISLENACRVIDAGADSIAVISSVYTTSRPEFAVAELKLLFNRHLPYPRGSILSIAGSDSGGGAGIQADVKTTALIGSYAATAITALTAQNTTGVFSVYGLPPTFVIEQIKTVLDDIPIDVIKIGMLHTPAIISALVEYFTERTTIMPLVVDPVMVAKGGASLLEREAVTVFCNQLLPLSYLLTPNIPEAESLTGRIIRSEKEMEEAARQLHSMGAANVLIKGGHLTGSTSCDILFNGKEFYRFSSDRIFTNNTHGTGCSYASAIAAYLSQGEPLKQSVEKAKHFITDAIRHAHALGKGHGPINHYCAAMAHEKEKYNDPA